MSKALSIERRGAPGCTGCFLRGVFGMFFVVGSLLFYFFAVRPLWSVYAATGWDEVPCVILSSEVEHGGGDGDTFKIAMTYRYEYDGDVYTGDRYHFMDISSSGLSGKKRVVQAYPPGKQTACYVNPEEPQESVIERGLTADMWWGVFPVPFLAIGIGGLIAAPRLAGTTSSAQGNQPPRGTSSTTSLASHEASYPSGPVVLKAAVSPPLMFLGALLICLFWNGIVSLFVYQVVKSFQKGDPEWFLTVFITPFVLIGLFLVGLVLYSFVALFNPRPELKLSSGRLPLGALGQVAWEFRGSVRSLRTFKLTLVGEEQATYRRGTDTHTDTERFFEHVFYEADHPNHIASGEAEFEIPAESMHSFEADNNKIVWSLHVHGEIPLRPDVSMSFPIQVVPREPADH
jgi:hypothetical protein